MILMRVMSLYKYKLQLFQTDFSGNDGWKLGPQLVLEDSMIKVVGKLMVLDFLLNASWDCHDSWGMLE